MEGSKGKENRKPSASVFLNSEIHVNHFLLIVIIFVLLNSIKIDFVDYFSLFPGSYLPIIHPSSKLLLYVVLNSLIFFSVFRLKNIIPFLLIYGLQTLYLFIHLSYVLYFDTPFHVQQFIADFYEGIMLTRHFSIPPNIKYLTVVIDLPFLVFIVLNYSKINQFLKLKRKINNYLLMILAASLIFLSAFSYRAYKIAAEINDRQAKGLWIGEIQAIDKLGLIGNDFLDLVEFKNEESIVDNFKYGDKLVAYSKKKIHNIICIQVETLDSNIINYSYKNKYICPFLHQLSSDCVYYPYMLFYHFAGGSSDAEFTIINGIIPSSIYPSFKIRNYSYPNSLVKELIKANFNAVIFHNNFGDFFNRKTALFKIGFHEFDDITDMHLKEIGWGAPDHEMLNFVKEKLKLQKTPFFYYIITMSSHEPFQLVQQYYHNELYDDIKNREIKGYLNSFSYVDYILNDFVTFVRNNFRNTYIFIYGDHNAFSLRDHSDIAFENLGVPLFIITPDNKTYRENKEIASFLDLGQTILYASGINFKVMTQGANLLKFPIENGPISSNISSSYDRKTMFGKDLGPFIDSRK